MGVSVMLFAFGPAVFFLFVERWKRLHPTPRKKRDNAITLKILPNQQPTSKPTKGIHHEKTQPHRHLGRRRAALLLHPVRQSVLHGQGRGLRPAPARATWQEKDKSDKPDVWKFEGATNKMYQLTVTEKEDKQGKFDAQLFKLRQEYFLDLIPSDCDYATNQADLVAAVHVPRPSVGPRVAA